MRLSIGVGVLSVGLLMNTGCGGEAEDTAIAGSKLTYHRDIAPLLSAKCGVCHAPGGIGPLPLSTYAEVSPAAGLIKAAVEAGTMPPWSPSDNCAKYAGDRALTAEQISQIASWVDDGAPEGSADSAPKIVEDTTPRLSRVDLELPMPAPYTPVMSPDEYRCFAIDWPAQDTQFVTGFGVKPGFTPIVHHVIAFLARPEAVASYQALDDADPAPGWSCFGGPGGDMTNAAWVGAWVPGSTGADLPAGTGIEIPVGSKLVVQMHYNTSTTAPAPDQTKLLIRTDKAVEKKAAIMPFTDISWVLNKTMDIPAHSNDVSHDTSKDPTSLVGFITKGAIASDVPLTIYDAGLHMHTHGKSAVTKIVRASGAEQCLLDIPSWNFHWQGSYRLAEPTVINPGDALSLKCTWDNPGAMDMNWGEGTADEMCLSTFLVTE